MMLVHAALLIQSGGAIPRTLARAIRRIAERDGHDNMPRQDFFEAGE